MNNKQFGRILQLCYDYQKKRCLTPPEYIDGLADHLSEDIILHFLTIQRHNQILQEIVEHFNDIHNITLNVDSTRFKVLFYILISALNPRNTTGIEQIFIINNQIDHFKDVLLYYTDEENQINTARIACKYFDNDYVMKNIVEPIISNAEIHRDIFDCIEEYEQNLRRKKTTVPIEMDVAKKSVRVPDVPQNTPAEIEPFRSSRIPKTTYEADEIFEDKINKEHKKNRERALKLLEQSRAMPDHGFSLKPQMMQSETHMTPSKRPTRIPLKKNVPIKENLTSVMRSAALFAKEKESCIERINNILKGGIDTELQESVDTEIREIKKKEELEETERKRLKCLLIREDAMIAKCKQREINKQKKIEFLEEKEKILKQLNEWKVHEKEKYKQCVEKTQQSNKNAKESERKMIEDKQCNARILQWELKQLQMKAMEEKEKELSRKIHIIQEIKAIGQVRAMDMSREFDKTECSNIGLLCEMSIAELEERLKLMKADVKREVDEKRKAILQRKEDKQKMIDEAKIFIQQNRTKKPKPEIRSTIKLEESSDIKDLKMRLEKARKIRKLCEDCRCEPCPLILGYCSK